MRHEFLALLAERPRHGYELGQLLKQRLGGLLPPLNAGQIYTTLQRLERDDLVSSVSVPEDGRHKRVYAITAGGRIELERWVADALPGTRLKDDVLYEARARRTGGDRRREAADRPAAADTCSRCATSTPGRDGARKVAALLVEGAALHLEADLAGSSLRTTLFPRRRQLTESDSRGQRPRQDL